MDQPYSQIILILVTISTTTTAPLNACSVKLQFEKFPELWLLCKKFTQMLNIDAGVPEILCVLDQYYRRVSR